MTFGGEAAGSGSGIGSLQQADADPAGSAARSTPASISSTPPTSIPRAHSELITGQALKNLKVPREKGVVATKVFGETGSKERQFARYVALSHHGRGAGQPEAPAARPRRPVPGGRRRAPQPPSKRPCGRSTPSFSRGHVRYIGVSNWAAWQIMKALGISERLGLARLSPLQAYYTIAGPRSRARTDPPCCRAKASDCWCGVRSRAACSAASTAGTEASEAGSRRTTFDFPPVNVERAYDCIDVMREIAKHRGVSVAQIAIAWLLHQTAVTSVIIGAKRVEQLDDNIAAAAIKLSGEELASLEQIKQVAGLNIRAGCSRARRESRRKQLAASYEG